MKLRIHLTFPLYVAAFCALLTVLQLGLYTYSGEAIALIVAIQALLVSAGCVVVHRMFAGR